MTGKRRLGALFFDKFELLDIFGPLEMFGVLPDLYEIVMRDIVSVVRASRYRAWIMPRSRASTPAGTCGGNGSNLTRGCANSAVNAGSTTSGDISTTRASPTYSNTRASTPVRSTLPALLPLGIVHSRHGPAEVWVIRRPSDRAPARRSPNPAGRRY